MSQHKEQQGFLTIAANTDTVDYLKLAYCQALNIKATQRMNKFAVIVDRKTASCLTEKHKKVFDYIIETDNSEFGPFGLETKVFSLTPFKETIKLESDLLITTSIDHWWTAFRLRDIVLSTGCKDYQQNIGTSRKYRKLFDDNALPDVYTGLMYFRFTQTAANFFNKTSDIFSNWNAVQETLLNCRDTVPTTDVVYALTASLIGTELCTLPGLDFLNFVHMKPAINKFDEDLTFKEVFVTEFDRGTIRINNVNQYHPIHYYDKDFITDEMIDYYEQRILG